MRRRLLLILITLMMVAAPLPVLANEPNGASEQNAQVTERSYGYEDRQPGGAWEDIRLVPFDEQKCNEEIENLASKFASQNEDDEIAAETAVDYPVSYDGRANRKVTSIKNQGSTCLCWDYAILATVESSLIATGLETETVDLSELHAAYFHWLAYESESYTFDAFVDGDKGPGGRCSYVTNLMTEGCGPVRESLVPMTTITSSTTVDKSLQYEHLYTLKNLKTNKYTTDTIDVVKGMISQYGGVTASYYSNFNYYLDTSSGDSNYYCGNASVNTNHAIEIVGWNDNYPASEFKNSPAIGNGAWLCKNSWGARGIFSSQGSGYLWISYYEPSLKHVSMLAVEMMTNPIYSTGVTISQTAFDMEKGNTAKLSATVIPANASDKSVTYSSTNEYVATVDENGLITATGYGQCEIWVQAGDQKSEKQICQVNVYKTGIQFQTTLIEGTIKDTTSKPTRKLYLYTTDGDQIEAEKATWSSSDANVAKVSPAGQVSMVGGGIAIITANYQDPIDTKGVLLKAQCVVYVTQYVTEIQVKEKSVTGNVGETYQISTTVLPERASQKVKYMVLGAGIGTSKDITSVTEDGLVSFLYPGTATVNVSATDGSGISTSITFTVVQQPTEIVTSADTYVLHPDESTSLGAGIMPANAYDRNCKFVSGDESIATVDTTGTVKGIKTGKTYVTITSAVNSSVTKRVAIEVVKNSVTQIDADMDTVKSEIPYTEIGKQQTVKFTVAADTRALLDNLVVSSSDTKVLTFDKMVVGAYQDASAVVTCYYTPLAVGSVTLTMTSNDGPDATIVSADVIYEIMPKPVTYVSEIAVPSKSIRLECGESMQLMPVVSPVDADEKTITYSSEDETIVTVSETGAVIAMQNPGATRIVLCAIDGSNISTAIDVVVEKKQNGQEEKEENKEEDTKKNESENTDKPDDADDKNNQKDENVPETPENGKQENNIETGNKTEVVAPPDNTNDASDTLRNQNGSSVDYNKEDAVWNAFLEEGEALDQSGSYRVSYDEEKNRLWILEAKHQLKKNTVIPGTLTVGDRSLPVYGIADAAFADENMVEKLVLPNSLRVIGEGAFEGCINLKSVKLGSNVESIGAWAFQNCTSLSSITIPSKVKEIGKEAFEGCKKLKKITIQSKKLTKVGSKAFYGIQKKATLRIPRQKKKNYQKLLKKAVTKQVKIKTF